MKLISKPRATAKGCNPFSDEMCCRVGRKPVSHTKKGDRFEMAAWQKEAYKKLVDVVFGILHSPTGSGKSVVQKALALARMLKGEKVVLAVPDTSISGSFSTDRVGDKRFLLPDNSLLDWMVEPQNFLFEMPGITSKGNIQRLIEFVQSSKETLAGRVLVCTHAALVRAHQEMMQEPWKTSPWKGVNLFIDESHHSKAIDDSEETEQEKTLSNELGKLVKHFVQYRPARLLLTTATWLRGDAMDIVPESCIQDFVLYERIVDEHLDEMEHLRVICFKFSIAADYPDALREASKDQKKTIVYLPPVRGEGDGGDIKLERLRCFQSALGRSKETGDGFTRTHATGCVSMDLVTVEGRQEVKEKFQQNKGKPDYIFVQNLFREGADWPQAERSLVMGNRGSLPMIIQMIGRLTRDFEDKAKVEFHVVIPRSISIDDDAFSIYTGAVFMTMALGWQFTVGLNLPPRFRTQKILRDLINECRETTMRGSEGKSSGETMRGIFEKVSGEKLSDEDAETVTKSLLACLKGSFRLAANAARGQMTASQAETVDNDIETNIFNRGALGVFEAEFGQAEFRAYRENYIGLPEITPQYADRTIFLHRCIYFKNNGQYVDPRTIKGAVELFGSKEALNKACLAEGL